MGWTYKLHAGVAIGLGCLLLVSAALTWLPGTPSWTEAGWPVGVVALLLVPVLVAAPVRVLLTRADRRALWWAFRCLPGGVQAGLGALALTGIVLEGLGASGGSTLQAAEVREGRYYAFETAPYARGTMEISRSRYLAVLEDDRRVWLTAPGVLCVVAAYAVLAAGELRRADRGAARS
ncbi:hypothetical protein GCM10023329_04850 [Streptomyces sanyensis]|uniref:Integral membrane protein n=1 Tax=Streptomyces sanyensis TaxID=568869 RepID=A0ABP8ZPE8_9ACTN